MCDKTPSDEVPNLHVGETMISSDAAKQYNANLHAINAPKVTITKELAVAIIEMDNIGYSEGLGPVDMALWEGLVELCEKVSGLKADSHS